MTTGNKIMAAPSDVPPEILGNAGLEPAHRGLLNRRVGAVSTPEAPSRVGTSTAGVDALYVTFNPSFVDGGTPVTGYTARAYDASGRQVGEQAVGAAEFKRTAVVRIGGLPASAGPLTVTVTASNAHGTSAPSLASLPLTPTAVTALPGAPTGPELHQRPRRGHRRPGPRRRRPATPRSSATASPSPTAAPRSTSRAGTCWSASPPRRACSG